MKTPKPLPTVARGASRRSMAPELGPNGFVDTALDYGKSLISSENFWKGLGGATTIAGAIASAMSS